MLLRNERIEEKYFARSSEPIVGSKELKNETRLSIARGHLLFAYSCPHSRIQG